MLIKKLLFLRKTEKNDQKPIYAPIMLEKGYLCRHNFFFKGSIVYYCYISNKIRTTLQSHICLTFIIYVTTLY